MVLIHSPLVGPLTWRAVARSLEAEGRTAVVPDLTAAVANGPPYEPALRAAVAAAVEHAAPGKPLVLVGHSAAGPLLPGIADRIGATVRGVVYVDSVLPHPGESWFDRAPDELAAHVRALAEDGVLPPWHEWFEPGAVDELLRDPELRREFVAEVPRLPLTYFEERRSGSGWVGPSAYLLLSDVYRDEAARAGALGMPVLERLGHHLAMLTEPEVVGAALQRLLGMPADG
ncbi:MAG: alpha/beta fold hydrolase [Propionibacteriales bacterium]|nr:alpha/beta fold hydrolase [Propionibacteriales bacterium]